MFAARLVTVSLSVFFLIYVGFSVAVYAEWQGRWLYSRRRSASCSADLLFALRGFSLIGRFAFAAVFTVPSFLLLEPRAVDEPIGGFNLALGLCGAALMCFGLVNAALALRRASRTIASWVKEANVVDSSSPVPVLRISRVFPALTAAGILRPRVLMSGAAEFVLTPKELRTALQHELAHVRRRDNLRKLLLRAIPFPGMRGLEAAWLEATEIAADDAAVSSIGEALDLAAALIKLSRLTPHEIPELTAALVHHSPAASVNVRVERLVAWSKREVSEPKYSSWQVALAGLATLAVLAMTYSQMLARVHDATEWLVR